MRDSLMKWKYEKMARKLGENLARKAIRSFYLSRADSVVPKVEELIPAGSVVAAGGSLTLQETGVMDLLRSGKYNFLDRDRNADLDSPQRREVVAGAFKADFYLCSLNAVTLNGEILQLDGTGNRAAACIYGPKQVIFVAGVNKVVSDIPAALERIKFIAPMNAKRLNLHTPCAVTGFCENCRSEERICESYAIIVDSNRTKNHYTLLLVGEELGL